MTQIIDSAFVTKDVVVGGGTFKQPSEQKAIGAGNDLLNGSVDIDGVVHVGPRQAGGANSAEVGVVDALHVVVHVEA